jgi:hypothetical protein
MMESLMGSSLIRPSEENDNSKRDQAPVCADYPLVEECVCDLRVVRGSIYRAHAFPGSPWKAQLEFADPFGERPNLMGFFHLGAREQPKAGKSTRYYAAWCLANGGPPKKRQVLSTRVFVGKFFRVLLRTTVRCWDANAVHPATGKRGLLVTLPPDQQYTTVAEIREHLGP